MANRAPTQFPNESAEYRAARNQLLAAEVELRRKVEEVAALRRKLPLGGAIPQDYAFDASPGPQAKEVRLSELFRPGKDVLAVYSFMYSADMEHACPSCTSVLDALDRTEVHASTRINLAVVAKSPIERILAHAKTRGWTRLRLLSSAGNTYNHDYHAESRVEGDVDGPRLKGGQLPILNVFVRKNGEVRHTFGTELLFADVEPGQGPRHVDAIWPLWNLLDFTPDGRGDWQPKLSYE